MSKQQPQLSQESARICPLVEDPGNRRLLEAYLEDHDRFVLVPPADTLQDTAFDVAVLDGAALETHTGALEDAKRAAEPILLPYLLLVPRTEPDLIETDRGRLVDSVLTRTIDEIVTLPIEQSELQWRIDALLRLRAQSIEATEQGKRYRSLFESIQDAIVVTDQDGTVTDVNPAGTELFGIDASTLRGTHVASFFEDTDAFETLVEKLDANPDDAKFTDILSFKRMPEGTFPGELTISRLTDEDGTTTGYIGEIRDDTDRQERIERIERLAEYRRVASTVNHLLVESTPDERVLPAIAEALATSDRFGCTFLALTDDQRIEFLCEAGSELTDSEVKAIHTEAYLDAVFETGTLEIADVTEPPFEQHVGEATAHSGIGIAIQYDERPLGIMTVHFPPDQSPGEEGISLLEELADDIGLALHDRELARELATFEEIVQRIDDPIMLQERNGTFRVVNEALIEYAGMDREELLGVDEAAFMDPETAAEIAERKRQVIKTGEPQTYEVKPDLPVFGRQTFQTTRYPHFDERGDIDGTVAICRDVSTITERNRHLRVLSRLLRHNLNNEMNVILGHAEMVDSGSAAERERAVARIREAGERLVGIADKERRIVDLLGEPETREVVDVCSELEAAVIAMETDYPDATIELRCADGHRALATPSLADAFEELLENAIIHAGVSNPRVEVDVTANEGPVTIAIGDSGPGIPIEERQVLAGENITPLLHGSGVGLWLVNHIVTQSEGELSITDRDPTGTLVEIRLPTAS